MANPVTCEVPADSTQQYIHSLSTVSTGSQSNFIFSFRIVLRILIAIAYILYIHTYVCGNRMVCDSCTVCVCTRV